MLLAHLKKWAELMEEYSQQLESEDKDNCSCRSGNICDDHLQDQGISKIKNDLYLSNYDASQKYELLSKLGIEQILTVGNDLKHCDCLFNQCDVDCSFDQKFKLMHILIDDDETEDIFQYFDQTHAFLKDKPTLVHCYAGISRSSTIVIAYLMKEYDMTYCSAFKLCKEKRSIICPNHGFRQQLRQYEESINKQKTLH